MVTFGCKNKIASTKMPNWRLENDINKPMGDLTVATVHFSTVYVKKTFSYYCLDPFNRLRKLQLTTSVSKNAMCGVCSCV